jgi:hypothetical protein
VNEEHAMIDPEIARKALREYHATTPARVQIEHLRQDAPELAERLGLNQPPTRRNARSFGGLRAFFASFGRSVHRLFS